MRGASSVPGILMFATMAACGLNTQGGTALDVDGPGGSTGGSGGPVGTAGGPIATAGHAGAPATMGMGGAKSAGSGTSAGTGGVHTGGTHGGGAGTGAGGGAAGSTTKGGGTGACAVTCTAEQYCDDVSGGCVERLLGGTPCNNSDQCVATSKYCTADSSGTSRCCDAQQCGQCFTCGLGHCAAVTVDSTCPADAPSDQCPAHQHCDPAAHTCMAHAVVGTACGMSTCADPTHVDASFSCTASGACNPGGASTDCLGFLCDSASGSCFTTCTDDSQCDVTGSDKHCIQGACRGKLQIGEACKGYETLCDSNNCVDDVCCTEACTGDCQMCNAPDNLGHCQAADGGTNPRNKCSSSGDDTCGRSGNCDGGTDCPGYKKNKGDGCGAVGQFCLNATVGSFTCGDDHNCDLSLANGTCNGNINCPNMFVPLPCPTSCGSGVTCTAGNVCTGGTCGAPPLKSNGTKCGNGPECLSGICVKDVGNDMICAANACKAGGDVCGPTGKATNDGSDCEYKIAVNGACCETNKNNIDHSGTCDATHACSAYQDTNSGTKCNNGCADSTACKP